MDHRLCCPCVHRRQHFGRFGHRQDRDVTDPDRNVCHSVFLRPQERSDGKIRPLQAPATRRKAAVLRSVAYFADRKFVVRCPAESIAVGNAAVCPVHVLRRFP